MKLTIDQLPHSSKLLNSLPRVLHSFDLKSSPKPPNLYSVHQVHGKEILEVSNQPLLSIQDCKADGLATSLPLKMIGIQSADCLPILFASKSKPCISAIHAGWRGLNSGILIETLKKFEINNVEPKDIAVAIGPSIRSCCFEVGQEVLDSFQAKWGSLLDDYKLTRMLDLQEIAKRQLLSGGVLKDNIDDLGVCTYCHPCKDSEPSNDELKPFASYRRSTHRKSSTKERQWSWIVLM